MLHPVPSVSRPDTIAPPRGRVARPEQWRVHPDPGPEVAVLLTGRGDAAAAARGYRTVLPRAGLFLYASDLSPAACRAAEEAGATVRHVAPAGRDALVRRMLAEVDADIYILADGASPDDVCLAPLIVAEIGQRGCDLVDVSRVAQGPAGDAGDRLLALTVEFLFGRGGDMLTSDFKACSRRFAASYRTTRAWQTTRAWRDRASALDLSLHALRMRLPTASVAALAAVPRPPSHRSPAEWGALLALISSLLVQERPRRVLGLLGLAIVALGLCVALPRLTIHGWRAALPLDPSTLLALALVACGGLVGATGAALDSLASARQEVTRLGVGAMPRRAERSHGAG